MESQPPPRLLVLPRIASKNASIVTLAHPRTLEPTRYYFCPDTGVYEFTRIAAPKSSFRSWFLSPGDGCQSGGEQAGQLEGKREDAPTETGTTGNAQDSTTNGYAAKNGDIFVATPLDSLFLLLPVVCPRPRGTDSEPPKALFLSSDNLFDQLTDISKDFGTMVKHAAVRQELERRLALICDSVEAGEEQMYRLSQTKLLQELCVKTRRVVSQGLPASMEEKFVTKALEVPIMSAKRPQGPDLETSPSDIPTSGAPTPALSESQSSNSTSLSEESIASDASKSTTVTVPDQPTQPETPPEVTEQLRLKTAVSYMLDAYCPTRLALSLKVLLASIDSPMDLKLGDEHLAHIAKLRAEAQASRSLGDFSRKRSINEDHEARESREEKKRRKDEEEKRKQAGMSRGVRDLQKVNTSGMKKMSDFFGKAAAKKKG